MRKIFCVLLLAGAGMIFAQEKEAAETSEPSAPGVKKNAVTVDTIPLFRGFIASDSDANTSFFCLASAYERLVAPHFSVGAELDLYPGRVYDVNYMYFSMAAAGRFYSMSEYMEKFFIGASLGFNSQSIDGKSGAKDGGFTGLLIGLKAGYKLMFTDMFFVEPSLSYTYSKTGPGSSGSSSSSDSSDLSDLFSGFFGINAPLNNGWEAGLRIGISF